MKYIFTRLLLNPLLLFFFTAGITITATAQVCAPLTVSSVNTTAAACPSGGVITVIAAGTGLSFQLISGPAGYSTAVNTTGIFGTLNAGGYVVEIRDACGNKTTRNATVSNTYPAFSVSMAAVSNVCTSAVQGGTISATVTGGKPPYQYDIVPLGNSPVYGAATAAVSCSKTVGSFDTYRVFAKDNCGEVRTYDIMLQPSQPIPADLWWEDIVMDRPCGETMDGLPTISWKLHLVDANGTAIGFNNMLGATYQLYKPVTANSISGTSANCSAPLGTLLVSGTITSGNIPVGDTATYPLTIPQEDLILVITNKCGQVFKLCYDFNGGNPVTPDATYRFIQQSCAASWNNQAITISNKYLVNLTPPYTFLLTKSNSTTVTNSTGVFTNLRPVNFPLSVRVTDACGRTVLKNFTMPAQGSALQFSVGPEWGLSCTTVKNTATAEIMITGGDLQGWADATNVVITGGTVTAVPVISPYNDWIPGYTASNLLAGYTYKVVITSLCGEKDSVQFTVPNDQWGQNTLNWNMTASVNALCGANKSTITADAGYTGYNVVNYYLYNQLSPNTVLAGNTTGVFNDVTPGNYKVKFVVPGAAWPCPGLDIKDSVNVIVLADGAGQTITRKTITTCEVNGVPTLAGKAIIEVSGSAPFTYEIIKASLIGTGGELWNLSSSGNPGNNYTWDIPLSGDPAATVYTLRTTDKCGNKVTTQASLQPVNPPAVQAQNNPCTGVNNYTLTLNPYGGNFTYRWVKLPDIITTLSTQNSITFPGAYTAASDGIYRCYAGLAGCVERYTDVTISSASCGFALPVKLISFNGGYSDNKASLYWITETETNFKQYEVERSTNGTDFIKISTVPAKNNTGTLTNYSLTDNLSAYTQPSVYYRLKMLDKDGRFSYSNIVRLSCSTAKSGLSIYPNPAKDEVSLMFTTGSNGNVLLKIIDKAGRIVKMEKVSAVKGANTVKLPDIGSLLTGTYMLEVQTSSGSQTAKFVKL